MSLEGLPNWEQMGQPDFDRSVEHLLIAYHAKHNPEWRVVPYEGSGGDGGRDVVVYNEEQHIEILYQLKYFPEGFSGGHGKARRPQIKKSYVAGMKLEPKEWVLVVPCNPKVSEENWVSALRKEGDPPNRILGRGHLDVYVAQLPEVLHALTRAPAHDALRAVGEYHLALDTMSSVQKVSLGVAGRLAGTSAFWGQRVTIDEGAVTHEIYAKRHDAREHEPLDFDVIPDDQTDSEKLSAWQEFVDFGGPSIEIDGVRVIRRGPSWFAGEDSNQHFKATGNPSRPVLMEIRAVGRQGHIAASLTGLSSAYPRGRIGRRIIADFPGGLNLQIFVRDEARSDGEKGFIRFNQALTGVPAREAERALDFHDSTRVTGRMEVWASDRRLTVIDVAPEVAFGIDTYARQLVSDLDRISKFFDAEILIPESLSNYDRMEIRRCRLLLDGYCIIEPALAGLNLTLNGALNGELESYITNGFPGVRTEMSLTYSFLGHKFKLPRAVLFNSDLIASNSAETLDALRSGKAEGHVLQLRNTQGVPFRAYIPELRTVDPTSPLIPEPLNIPGIEEHRAQSVFGER